MDDDERSAPKARRFRGPSHRQTRGVVAIFGVLLMLYGWRGRVGMLDFVILEVLFLLTAVRMIWHLFYAAKIRHRISAALCALVIGLAIAAVSLGRLEPNW